MQFPSLVIFDMDGLMFDTEKLVGKAWHKAGEHFGFDIDESIIQQFVGRTNQDILERMAEIFGEEAPVQEWRKYVQTTKRALETEIRHMPEFKKKGLDSLLTYLKSNNVKTAVASSSEKKVVNIFLDSTNTKPYIDYCVSGDEVVNGKPNPEIFLTACQIASVPANQAIVLEDSPSGLKAANSAGIPCIFVPDTVIETPELRALVTEVLADLDEVREYLQSLKNIS